MGGVDDVDVFHGVAAGGVHFFGYGDYHGGRKLLFSVVVRLDALML